VQKERETYNLKGGLMEKFFTWYRERTQTEKILLTLIPFLGIVLLYFQVLGPLLEEKSRLEEELARLRDTVSLNVQKMKLKKEYERLKEEEVLEPFTIKDVYEAARRNGVVITYLERGRIQKLNASFSGDRVVFSRGTAERRRGGRKEERKTPSRLVRVTFEPFTAHIVGDRKKVLRFIQEVQENRLILLGGIYTGCLSQDVLHRKKTPPLVCELRGAEYERALCEDTTYPDRYSMTFIILNVGE